MVKQLAAQAKKKRKDKLEVRVEVAAHNSKAYYVLSSGQAYRLPCTGDDTVADAVRRVKGVAERAATSSVWTARPAPAHRPDQILPVDWNGIVRGASTATNYQLLPGDRVFVGGSPEVRVVAPNRWYVGNNIKKWFIRVERILFRSDLSKHPDTTCSLPRNFEGKTASNRKKGGLVFPTWGSKQPPFGRKLANNTLDSEEPKK